MYRLCVHRCASTFSLRYTTKNEPILEYRRNSNEIQQIQKILEEYKLKVTRIPCIIDGKEFWTNDIQKQVLPFDHHHVLAEYCYANKEIIQKAIDRAVKNQSTWDAVPIEQRANIFLKAADLAADLKWRSRLVASTMLGQGKTVFQAEIDAACELIDFWRFNVQHMASAMAYQPTSTQDSDNSY
ncbi:unnamed protein product, partial [Rotaria magnacalcarata]